MSELGTAGRPPIDVGKLREFLGHDGNWIQTAAISAVFKVGIIYGMRSVPLWNELFELAMRSEDIRTKVDCQLLINKYIKNNVGNAELLPKLRAEAEIYEGKYDDSFFIEAAINAIRCGHREDPIEVLAHMVHKDDNPPEIRDEIFLELLRNMGHGKEFKGVWEQLKAAIVRRESKAEISHMENLRDLMKPQGKMRGTAQFNRPVSVQPGKIERKVARRA